MVLTRFDRIGQHSQEDTIDELEALVARRRQISEQQRSLHDEDKVLVERLATLRKSCTHRHKDGRSAWGHLGMFGSMCSICGEDDL
jgi:uncharacterized coiled-coil protein SlyX